MAERTETLHIRLKPESMNTLRKLAAEERRSVSDLCRLMLLDGIEARTPKPAARKRR